ncbi:hypothetical protein SRHO_G00175830 [Serrasalmus rhombeus]
MEDQASSPTSASLSEASKCSSITAQNAGVAVVPQLTNCHVGSLTLETHVNPKANAEPTHQQDSAFIPNIEKLKEKLQGLLKGKCERIFEGIAKRGNPTLLNKIYTKLYITEGERGGLNKEHEIWQIDTALTTPPEQDIPVSCNDIFKPLNIEGIKSETEEDDGTKGFILSECEKGQPRVVLTKGIAGIGKTVSVQKFILDWAEGKANQDIDLLLVLPFRELNSIKDEKQSLHELLLKFFSELKEFGDTKYYDDCKILFIFDGLDESQLPMAFRQRRVSDVSKTASLDELMTNLIDGNLLPSALVWITSRPAAIDKIPPDLIHRMTEVRGFTDLKKEEYFRKRISDQSLASRIISHVKDSRTLEIMCHIPVFCWITATVLEQMLRQGIEKIPSSLTELYTRFLLIQTSKKKEKFLGKRESDPLKLSDEDVQLILKLGKLAFDNLQKSNIEFSEYDMNEYHIDVTEASLRSGVFTEIVKEDDPIFSVKQYSFVHLSFQEYLAAFFVIQTYADTGVNAMQSSHNKISTKQSLRENDEDSGYPPNIPQQEAALHNFHKCAIDEALKSDSGHLDLFLRFLLGLSLESSQKLLKSFSMCVHNGKKNIQQTIQYLKSKLREEGDGRALSLKRCPNLIHCLMELNDHSMAEEIQRQKPINRQTENKELAANILVDKLEKTDHIEHLRPEMKRKRLDHGGRSQEKACVSELLGVLQFMMSARRRGDILQFRQKIYWIPGLVESFHQGHPEKSPSMGLRANACIIVQPSYWSVQQSSQWSSKVRLFGSTLRWLW